MATLVSLLALGAVVAAVAFLVLRTSPTATESAAYIEPAGTTIPAPEERAPPPTVIPTVAPDQSAKGIDGHTQAIAMLPTVAAPQPQLSEAPQPPPTPRAMVLPTVVPLTLPTPAATQPPSQPVTTQPVESFVSTDEPLYPVAVSAAQPADVVAEPTSPASQQTTQSAVAPTEVSAARDNLQRAREMQANRVRRGSNRARQSESDLPASGPVAGESAAQLASAPVFANGAIDTAPSESDSLPDANAIRNDVAARINAPRP